MELLREYYVAEFELEVLAVSVYDMNLQAIKISVDSI